MSALEEALVADLDSKWRQNARCAQRGVDVNVFFSTGPGACVKVREICTGCSVIRECALFGVAQDAGDPVEVTGRWASYSVTHLHRMRSGDRPGWGDLMDGRLPERGNTQ